MPEVSVILPVYNAERYVGRAIDSILRQTFADLELIIINDCSQDSSEKVILSYTDTRIRYSKNETNKGLIYSLNTGIKLAKGKYIARMDADDISLEERLALQRKWLEEHPATSVVAGHIVFINDTDEPTGNWPLEAATSTFKSIKKTLPRINCIAHPTVMLRSAVFDTYQYSYNQKNIEDYDLWLQLVAGGKIIEKIDTVLLLYRVHSQSVSSLHIYTGNTFLERFRCKRRFLYGQFKKGKINWFIIRVSMEMVFDLIKGTLKRIKKRVS